METAVLEENEPEKGRLAGNAIKWIAIACMLTDHIAWGFVPFVTPAGQIMHVVGRITAPTMCFFIAEGYHYTHSVKKYALRLFLFALISQFPFTLFESHTFAFACFNGSESFSVIYTLLLSLLAVWAWDTIKDPVLRFLAVLGLCLLALPGDWMFMDVVFSIVFFNFRGDFKKQALWFSAFAAGMVFFDCFAAVQSGYSFYNQLFQAGVFLCLPLLALYNGKKGGGRYSKWTFYIFYPLHLLILGLIRYYL